jgi:hypothetical protein
MSRPSYVVTDGVDNRESMYGSIQDVSAEQKAITSSMLSALTVETKFVLYAIFNTPGELSKLLLGDRPRSKDIRKYLKCLGWKQKHISKTLTELKRFVKEILT